MTYRNKNGFCAILGGGFLDIETLVAVPAKSVKKLKEEGFIRHETDQGDKREEAVSCGKKQESPPGDETNRLPAE